MSVERVLSLQVTFKIFSPVNVCHLGSIKGQHDTDDDLILLTFENGQIWSGVCVWGERACYSTS